MAIILALKSSVAPAISAGILPLILDVKSWMYPVSILFGLVLLVALLFVWKHFGPTEAFPVQAATEGSPIEVLESAPSGRSWMVALLLFTVVLGLAAQISG